MNGPVDISPDHLKVVEEILHKNLPSGVTVWVFGSRASWATSNSSDLDLALEGDIDHDTILALEMAFEESSLPYTVDIIGINQVSNSFRQIVEKQKIFLLMTEDNKVERNNRWKQTTVEEFVPFAYGKSLPDHTRNQSGQIPVFGSNGIIGYHDSALTDGPTIIVGRKGTVGTVHYSEISCWPIDTTFFFTHKDADLVRFKYYILKMLDLSNMNTDSAVPGLNRTAAHARELHVPDEPEQRRITHILKTLDDKIELNRRMNQTLEEMARALFQSWFVDFDPVHAKMDGRWLSGEPLLGLPACIYDLFPGQLADSEIGKIPDGWEVKSLHHYAMLNPESWSRTNTPKGVEYIDLANVKSGVIKSINHYLWKNAPSRARRILRPGDTIVGTVRPGNKSYALIGESGLTGSTGFAVLRPIRPEYRELVYLASTAPNNIKYLAHQADGAAYPAVRPKVVSDTRVAVPLVDKNVDILNQFSNIVAPIVDKMLSANAENNILAAQRDTLLPRLMSGEIRVTYCDGATVA